MRRLINIISLSILFFSFTDSIPVIRVRGYLDDVSPNEQWVLYKAPRSCKREDINAGTLSIVDIEKGEIITVDDDVTLEDPRSIFLNDSMVAKPAYGRVVCYDVHQKQIVNDLITFDPELEFLEFSISPSKEQIALLLRNFKERQIILQVFNIVSHEKYEIVHEFLCLGQCGDTVGGPIYWFNNHIVYSMQNRLYDYQVGDIKSLLISDNLYDYALNQDEVLFIEWDQISTYKFKKFSFEGLRTEDFILQENVDLKYVKFIGLDVASIDHVYQAILNIEQQKFYMVKKDGLLEPQPSLLIYKSPRLTIQKELIISISSYDKVTRVVDGQELVIEKVVDQ